MPAFRAYMLRCADGSYYTGHTDDLDKRMFEHQTGAMGGYTSTRLPVTLVWSQDFGGREEALSAELQIKRWSRKKKEALICSDWQGLREAARKDFSKQTPDD